MRRKQRCPRCDTILIFSIGDTDGWCWRCQVRKDIHLRTYYWQHRMARSLQANERARRALHRDLGQF
jgi:tRNA(Ile2) C34 agmatinyltransferase TiaS